MSGYFISIRMQWMHESLRVYGYLNRSHLMTKFGQSNGNSALDFKEFLRRYPGYCEYSIKTKRYELCAHACSGRHDVAPSGGLDLARKGGIPT